MPAPARSRFARLRKRCYLIATGLSLLLSLATVTLWIRSEHLPDGLLTQRGRLLGVLQSDSGELRASVRDGYATSLFDKGPIPFLHFQYASEIDDDAVYETAFSHPRRKRLVDFSREDGYQEGLFALPPGQHMPPDYHVWSLMFPHWVLAALFAILPAIWLLNRVPRSRKQSPHACPNCGYDLRASPDRCPECGTVYSEQHVTSNGRPLGST